MSTVGDQPAWNLGLEHHLIYLERTPAQYFTGQWQSAHTENPASPYYTSDGSSEASASDLNEGGAPSALQAIDEWLSAPFHAVGMFRSRLSQVALVDHASTGYAGLDLVHGLHQNLPAPSAPIMFPGPGITTDLLTYEGGESPDPLETCGWSGARDVGLPLILLLPQPPSASLSATLTGPDGAESTATGDLCVVDERTYHSSDPVYGPGGSAILQADNDVFLIPRRRLIDGAYAVSVQQPGQADVGWSFTAQLSPPTSATPPSIQGMPRAASTLRVVYGEWTGNPGTFRHGWLRCNGSGTDCSGISGATGETLKLTQKDVGHTIRVAEAAGNAAGTEIPAYSGPTAVVRAAPAPPRPLIRGIVVRGHSIRVSITAPAQARLQCALTPALDGRFGSDRFSACGLSVTYSGVASGLYRFTVRSDAGSQSRQARVR